MPGKNSTPTKSWRDQIKVHPAADTWPMLGDDELRALGEDIKKNGMQMPIACWWDKGWSLLDGRNRLDAAEAIGLRVDIIKEGNSGLKVTVRGKSRYAFSVTPPTDPYAFVDSANLHRRHLTPEEKRERIATLVKAQPEKSDRQIAKLAKVDHKTVGSVRREKEATGEVPQLTRTVGADGKARPARAAKDPKPTAPKQTDVEEFTTKPAPVRMSLWQRERKARVEDGIAVIASMRNGKDGMPIDSELIDWAAANGLLVRIDRQSDWGNPFVLGEAGDPGDGDRESVIQKFRWYLDQRPSLQRRLPELRGKVLACWCHPEACHGDVLCELVNKGHVANRTTNGQIDPGEIPDFLKREAAGVTDTR